MSTKLVDIAEDSAWGGFFLSTSYAEGFGLPPLEAMACGTTVVTTDCKGNRDYAIDGYNCLMTPRRCRCCGESCYQNLNK